MGEACYNEKSGYGCTECLDCVEKKPGVGKGATICYYSDRVPCTIVEVGKNHVVVQEDRYTRTDSNGMSESQSYTYERNPEGAIKTFKRTRKFKDFFTDNGRAKYGEYGCSLRIGNRERYFDFSF
jgi:hypothetical protein